MLIAVLLIGLRGDGRTLIGTPYSSMNCAQFACAYTGHKTATAAQLFAEGRVGIAKAGDIVAFNGVHVAVMTPAGLVDSTPERGVGFVGAINPHDPWYAGPVRIIR